MASRRHSAAWVGAVLLWALVAGYTPPVYAQSARDAAAARALFQEGVGCADQRDWHCAADRFQRAYDLRPSPVIAYNLGTALLALGRLVEGAEVLRQVTRDEAASETIREDARHASDAATPRIGRLTVHVRGEPDGVTIAVDGHELSASLHGAAAPIDPGEHDVEARRDGAVIASAHVAIAEAQIAELELTVPPRPPPDPSVEAASDTPSGDDLQVPADALVIDGPPPATNDDTLWIGLGVGAGVLLVAGGIILGVVLAQPQEPSPFGGNLGVVEVGRP